MSQPRDNEREANASPSPTHMDSLEVVARLIDLSSDDRDLLNSYNLSTCDNRIQRLISFIKNPMKETSISEVLGQLALLWQCKAELQVTEHIDQLRQLQHKFEEEREINSNLRQEIADMREEIQGFLMKEKAG